MAISDIKSAIKTSITNTLGIECHTSIPVVFTPPCSYIRTAPGNYNVTLPRSKMQRQFEVTLLVGQQEDLEDAQARLDTYLLPTGTSSMALAIKNASVSTGADFIRVESDTGLISIENNQTIYSGCRWTATCMI